MHILLSNLDLGAIHLDKRLQASAAFWNYELSPPVGYGPKEISGADVCPGRPDYPDLHRANGGDGRVAEVDPQESNESKRCLLLPTCAAHVVHPFTGAAARGSSKFAIFPEVISGTSPRLSPRRK